MDDKERTAPEDGVEQSYDRRRGPRRGAGAAPAGDDRRRYERRKTPGVSALLDQILTTPADIEPNAAEADEHTS